MDEPAISAWQKVRHALVALGVVVGLVFIIQDGRWAASEQSLRAQCKKNLQQICLAMHNYHDKYGSFPPAYIADAGGRPAHSWRVLLLPFLGQQQLYDSYRFDEPWHGPHNVELAAKIPAVYRCPADESLHPGSSHTNYMVIVGPSTVFPGERPISLSQIPDGSTNTTLVVESIDAGVSWIQPTDLHMDEALAEFHPKAGPGISSRHEEGFYMGLCDGSVRFFSGQVDIELLQNLMERCDGRLVSVEAN